MFDFSVSYFTTTAISDWVGRSHPTQNIVSRLIILQYNIVCSYYIGILSSRVCILLQYYSNISTSSTSSTKNIIVLGTQFTFHVT